MVVYVKRSFDGFEEATSLPSSVSYYNLKRIEGSKYFVGDPHDLGRPGDGVVVTEQFHLGRGMDAFVWKRDVPFGRTRELSDKAFGIHWAIVDGDITHYLF